MTLPRRLLFIITFDRTDSLHVANRCLVTENVGLHASLATCMGKGAAEF